MFGFLYSWFWVFVGLWIKWRKPQTLPNLRLPLSSDHNWQTKGQVQRGPPEFRENCFWIRSYIKQYLQGDHDGQWLHFDDFILRFRNVTQLLCNFCPMFSCLSIIGYRALISSRVTRLSHFRKFWFESGWPRFRLARPRRCPFVYTKLSP